MAFGDFTVVRSTVKNVLNSSGVLASVAVNTPAFEFNADGSYKGLLVEPAGTNLLLYSQEFDNAYWTKSEATISANAIVAPDGTTTADKLVEGAGTVVPQVFRTGATASNVIHTLSVFAKAGERDWLVVNNNDGLQSFRSWFNLSTGTIGTVDAGSTAEIEDVGDGWYRCSVTRLTSVFANSGAYFQVSNADNVSSYTGDGTSGIYIWGAQLETGSVATSYIPTVASTATRTADDISLSSASSLIGQTQGTIYMEVDWRWVSTAAAQVLIEISDNSADNRASIYNLSSAPELRMLIVSNGAIQSNQGADSTAYTGIVKIALAYAQNDAVLYKDGASISTDGSIDFTSLATMDTITLGQNFELGVQANMWIRSVALFPTRLSNATLESLTTL